MTQSSQPHSIVGAAVKHFGLGIVLIVAASAILLISDSRKQQDTRAADAPKNVALINYVSVAALEDGEAGMIAGLKEGGFVDGLNLTIKHYNAEGDRSAAILIAKEAVGGDFDAVLTISTPVLQAVAGANLDAHRTHIFTLSTDPWGAGVGISRTNPAEHPPYMTGQGSIPPVDRLFEMAREANPRLKKVGVAWNPAESNSEAATKLAREACRKLHIELSEVTIDSSSAVLDAGRVLVARNVDAIWAGGDATVAASIETLIGTANDGGIPVFANTQSNVKVGALFSLGPDYGEVGHAGGLLAARVLKGTSPAAIPVENYSPEVLAINLVVEERFRANWKFGRDWAKQARLIVDKSGAHTQTPATAKSSSGK
jgi:putative tryptophan/tyrosine transport system substrate-binding protein